MAKKNLREISVHDFGAADEDNITSEEIQTGSLQRIASALERQCKFESELFVAINSQNKKIRTLEARIRVLEKGK